MSTIPVRIRHINDSKAVALTHWAIADLDALIRLLNLWGISSSYGDEPGAAFGQFRVDEAEAYFEVIFGEDE